MDVHTVGRGLPTGGVPATNYKYFASQDELNRIPERVRDNILRSVRFYSRVHLAGITTVSGQGGLCYTVLFPPRPTSGFGSLSKLQFPPSPLTPWTRDSLLMATHCSRSQLLSQP